MRPSQSDVRAWLFLPALCFAASCGGNRDIAQAPSMAEPPAMPPQSQPLPPAGAAASMRLPMRLADGSWQTPMRDLSDADALWHVRMALNVAALSCRADPAEPQLAAYNRLLGNQKALLASTNAVVDREYRAKFASRATDMRDDHNTRVYNFFALPPVQPAFCAAAYDVGTAIAAMDGAALRLYARSALTALEQPFISFYDSYARYQIALADWQAGRLALAAAPAPVSVQASAPAVRKVDLAASTSATAKPYPAKAALSTLPRPATQPAAATGAYVVQLGAYADEQGAADAWQALNARQSSFGKLPLVRARAKVNGKSYHRLAISGLATRDAASALCGKVKASGGDCFVRARSVDDAPIRFASTGKDAARP